jgi:cation:H+ antiporter
VDDVGVHPGRQGLAIGLAIGLTFPALLVRITGADVPHPEAAVLYGMAIVGSAFMLSWAAEVAQLDISAGLAIAVLAFIAVLPEYAVSFVFARNGGNAVAQYGAACKAPDDPSASPCSLVLANMTGANRLLIGIGWSLVVFIVWYRTRKRSEPVRDVRMGRSHSVEVAFLAIATLYSLTLPLKHSITLFDSAVLIGIFAAYTLRISKAPAEEPDLVGPARLLGTFTPTRRRLAVLGLFVYSAAVIVLFADRFAEALVGTGKDLGISEFLLVQWLAPLASEAPELLVAGLYAWRLHTNPALGTLVSSKVNQWTLLVGTLPIVFAMALGAPHGLPIDPHTRQELFLTAAQSFFGVAVLVTLSISTKEAMLLFGLFWGQFVLGAIVPSSMGDSERIIVGIAYLVLGVVIFTRERHGIRPLFRDGFRTPYATLSADHDGAAEPAAEIAGE